MKLCRGWAKKKRISASIQKPTIVILCLKIPVVMLLRKEMAYFVNEKKRGGMGIASVEAIVKRYNGYSIFESDADSFRVYMSVPSVFLIRSSVASLEEEWFFGMLKNKEAWPMVVGICEVTFRAEWVTSLKEKRMVVKSLVEKTRHKFNVAVAEVDKLDVHQAFVIGFACVSNEAPHVERMLQTILDYMENNTQAECIQVEKEVL